jgi:L-ascorbate metabolism protein UlaG (beta-lactamase superfamily)
MQPGLQALRIKKIRRAGGPRYFWERYFWLSLGFLLALFSLPTLAQQAQQPQPHTQILWLGHSAVRITTPGGKNIVIDPFIMQNPATPRVWKDYVKLGPVDLLLVTHGHADHTGDVFALSRIHRAPVYAPAGLASTFQTLGLLPPDLTPMMNKGGTVTPLGPNIKISMVHADHSSEFVQLDPFTNRRVTFNGGEPAGFIIELENGFRIYHMGDTALFSDLRLIAQRYHPDLVMIPIGGTFTMDPKDAAIALKEYLKPKYAIPIHYGTFPALTGTPQELIEALGPGTTQVIVMQPGDTHEF